MRKNVQILRRKRKNETEDKLDQLINLVTQLNNMVSAVKGEPLYKKCVDDTDSFAGS